MLYVSEDLIHKGIMTSSASSIAALPLWCFRRPDSQRDYDDKREVESSSLSRPVSEDLIHKGIMTNGNKGVVRVGIVVVFPKT